MQGVIFKVKKDPTAPRGAGCLLGWFDASIPFVQRKAENALSLIVCPGNGLFSKRAPRISVLKNPNRSPASRGPGPPKTFGL